jgi:hypothetical protein
MKPSRPGVLKVGDRIQFDGHTQTVVGLSGTLVRLAAHDRRPSVVQLAHLLASEGFEVLGGTATRKPPLSASALAGLRAETADDALRLSGTSSRSSLGRTRKPLQARRRGLGTIRRATRSHRGKRPRPLNLLPPVRRSPPEP